MAQKKTFKADLNPALQFISTPQAEAERAETATETETPSQGKPPAGYRINPLYIEKRSKRLQVLLTPSLYERVRERATAEGYSVNDMVNRILEEGTKEQ